MKPLLHPGDLFQGYKIPVGMYVDPNISTLDTQGEIFLQLIVEIFADQKTSPRITCSCKEVVPFIVLSRCFFVEKKERISKTLTNHIKVVCLSCKKTAWITGPDQKIIDQWRNNQAIGKRLLSSHIEEVINKQLEKPLGLHSGFFQCFHKNIKELFDIILCKLVIQKKI